MSRKTIPIDEMEKLGGGGWLELYKFQTAAPFPCEIAARKNRQFLAAKCLLLATSVEVPASENTSVREYCRTLLEIGPDNVRVLLLASDRPITYFEDLEFTENYQLELPGGLAEPDENQRQAALREAIEEGGLQVSGQMQFLQSASLLAHPHPFDAGSHAEVYSIETALVRGTPAPPEKEGIIPEKCELVPLPRALSFLQHEREHGVCVEGYAVTALHMLEAAMWREVTGESFPWAYSTRTVD